MTQFPPGETHGEIEGAVGRLEVITLNVEAPKAVGIICHPHPLHQGTMNNKVVYTISRAFQQKQIASVRFNYRGVGKSEGQYGDSVGEVDDLMAVIEWVNRVCHQPKIVLAGFSFGAYIAAQGASRIDCQQLFSVAPAVTNQAYDQLAVSCPWVVIQGDLDEVIAPQSVYDWAAQVQAQQDLTLLKMDDASHFFHGKLIPLRTLIETHLVEI